MTGASTKLSGRVLSLLRCPHCGGRMDLEGGELVCGEAGCGRRFGMVNGAPVLIDESASLFSAADVVSWAKGADEPRLRWEWLRGLLRGWRPHLLCNRKAAENYRGFARLLLERERRPLVLVIGGKEIGTGLSSLLADPAIELLETDVVWGPRVAVVCDGQQLPLAEGSADGVVIQAVLDDVVDPERCVAEIYRVLKPQGVVYAETPFLQPVHDPPFDFVRFTRLGHRRLFRCFEEVASGAVGGPGMALAAVYHAFVMSFARRPVSRRVASFFAQCTAFWLKYLDYWWLLERDGGSRAASGYYFLGCKSARVVSDREVIAGEGKAEVVQEVEEVADLGSLSVPQTCWPYRRYG